MDRCKQVLRYLLFPHIAVLVLLVPVSTSLLIYAFVFGDAQSILTYASYALSAYALTILCVRIRQIIRFIRRIRKENRYIVRYTTDPRLRVHISLYGSLLINTGYAIFQLGLGFYHASVWFYALAVYYILLAVMRFFLLRYTRAHVPGANRMAELCRYRACGIALLMVNLAFSVIVAYIVWQNRGFRHHEITTIAMAAFTFGTLTMAIINVIRYRKYHSPVYSAAKAVSLASAAVSMLTLEAAMLSAFGDGNSEAFRQLMTGLTGLCILLLILTMAIYMIVTATKQLKKLKEISKDGQ